MERKEIAETLETVGYEIEFRRDVKNLSQYNITQGLTRFFDGDGDFSVISIATTPDNGEWRETLALTLEGKLILIAENFERGMNRFEVSSQIPFVDYLRQVKTNPDGNVEFFDKNHLLDDYPPEELKDDFNKAYIQILLNNENNA